MTPTTAKAQRDVEDAATSFEGEIREFVRRDVTPLTRRDASSGEFAASNVPHWCSVSPAHPCRKSTT